MKLIYGELSSGKSTESLKLVKDKPDVLYISLDQDRSISEILSKGFKNVELQTIKNCFIIDIEFALIGKKYKTVVVDSLNFIKLVEDVNHEFNLKRIVKGLEYLHYTYDVEIIATYNILRNIDNMKTNIKSFFNKKDDWELVETRRHRKIKDIVKYLEKVTTVNPDELPPPIPEIKIDILEKKGVVPENFW